jgi:hypothetical protein
MKDILERLLSRATHTFIIQGNPNLYYDAAHEIERLRAENEKLREALAQERERCARIAEQARDDTCDGPVAWSMADCIAAAIRESGG